MRHIEIKGRLLEDLSGSPQDVHSLAAQIGADEERVRYACQKLVDAGLARRKKIYRQRFGQSRARWTVCYMAAEQEAE